jgi:2-dehydro-3-deoxyglucarate aldolase
MSLKSKLSRSELTIGSWVTLGHPSIAEIMAAAGFDWLVLDMEHSVLELSEVQSIIQVLDGKQCPAIVRLTSNHPDQIKRVMDAGATGVMVPMIKSAADARAAVDGVYYPPRGQRGVGLARAQGYGASFQAYRQWLEDNAVIVVMIEHVDAVKAIDDILAVPGIDAYIIGPYDLSGSMGRPGDFNHPDVQAAIAQVLQAGQRAQKPGGIHVIEPDPEALQQRIQAGFNFLGYGLDIRILDSICRNHLQSIRATLENIMKKFVISTSSFDLDNNPAIQRLLQNGFQAITNPHRRKLTEDEIIELLSMAQVVGLIAGIEPLTERVFQSASPLKVISRCGAGMDSVDLAAAQETWHCGAEHAGSPRASGCRADDGIHTDSPAPNQPN